MKILAIEYNDTSIYDLKKFSKEEITIYRIPSKDREEFVDKSKVLFFDTMNIKEQVKKINQVKDKFDICIVTSWSSARIAYLADLNYIMWFNGNDIRFPPFLNKFAFSSSKKPRYNLNFLERFFYKKILDNAIVCITGSEEMFEYLKNFRKDSIRIDRAVMDTGLFKPENNKLKIKKFTFFCPQRITFEKGTDIIWKAIALSKSDFDFIQVDWLDKTIPFSKFEREELIKNKPGKVKLISKIPRDKIYEFYTNANALIGDMKIGYPNNIEREAALCKIPVLSYNNPEISFLIDDKEVKSPFLPQTKDPKVLAELMDKIVESEEFRNNLSNDEYEFIKELGDPHKAAHEWDSVFRLTKNNVKSIKKNSSSIRLKLRQINFTLGKFFHFYQKQSDFF